MAFNIFPGLRAGPGPRWWGALSTPADAKTHLSELPVCKSPDAQHRHGSFH